VVPLLNVQKHDLPLKTEIVYFLKEHQIDIDCLLCLDDMEPARLNTAQIVLVDHHVSPFRDRVLFVVDHRPLDEQANLPKSCQSIIVEVGSCATLVFDLIQKQYADDSQYLANNFQCILKLLYGTIVLDTVNFSKEADKARPLDHEAAERIERIIGISETLTFRTSLFNRLVAARADVSTLNALQMLSKDMKLLRNERNGIVVAIPGYPILVQDYVNLSNAEESVRKFGQTNNCDVIVLMGMKVTNESVRRDSGIINIKNAVLFEKVC
jgi:exopolyphosphatase